MTRNAQMVRIAGAGSPSQILSQAPGECAAHLTVLQSVKVDHRQCHHPWTTTAVKQNRAKSMVTFLILLILWVPYLMKRLLPDAQQTRTPIQYDTQEAAPGRRPRARSLTDGQDGQSWSALDDHQLTRLLTESAPRTTSEKDLA
jgi:hypothetical protein